MPRPRILLAGLLGLLPALVLGTEPIPDPVRNALSNNCLDCHDADTKKGDVNLDRLSIDWSTSQNLDLWLRAREAIDQGLMPPPKKKQPSEAEREAVLSYLDKKLRERIPIGGTLPRRLNQAEYEA
ncbi:MAG: hypothetical protein OSA43_11585, partial [Pirellulales bacterium]|nr:hypothetical protein [Pirellulales bacterium]